jgi:hypothetical protein
MTRYQRENKLSAEKGKRRSFYAAKNKFRQLLYGSL